MRRLLAKHRNGIDGFKEDDVINTINIMQQQSLGDGELPSKFGSFRLFGLRSN